MSVIVSSVGQDLGIPFDPTRVPKDPFDPAGSLHAVHIPGSTQWCKVCKSNKLIFFFQSSSFDIFIDARDGSGAAMLSWRKNSVPADICFAVQGHRPQPAQNFTLQQKDRLLYDRRGAETVLASGLLLTELTYQLNV